MTSGVWGALLDKSVVAGGGSWAAGVVVRSGDVWCDSRLREEVRQLGGGEAGGRSAAQTRVEFGNVAVSGLFGGRRRDHRKLEGTDLSCGCSINDGTRVAGAGQQGGGWLEECACQRESVLIGGSMRSERLRVDPACFNEDRRNSSEQQFAIRDGVRHSGSTPSGKTKSSQRLSERAIVSSARPSGRSSSVVELQSEAVVPNESLARQKDRPPSEVGMT